MTLEIDPLHTAGRQMMRARVVAKAISFSILKQALGNHKIGSRARFRFKDILGFLCVK